MNCDIMCDVTWCHNGRIQLLHNITSLAFGTFGVRFGVRFGVGSHLASGVGAGVGSCVGSGVGSGVGSL